VDRGKINIVKKVETSVGDKLVVKRVISKKIK